MPLFVEQLQQLQDVYQLQCSGKDSKFQDAEIIVVAIRLLGEESDLLSWAVNTAAKPGDCIVALHVHSIQEELVSLEEEAEDRPLRLAKDVAKSALVKMLDPYVGQCAKKQVKLEARIAGGENVEKVLVEQATALKATILLLGSSGRALPPWCTQEPASYCAERLPARCSVLVVKDSKIFAYKENSDPRPVTLKPRQHRSAGGTFGSFPRKFFCAVEPDVTPTPLDSPTGSKGQEAANQAWEEATEGLSSPRGVLEGAGESEGSSPPSSSACTALSPSLSTKPFLLEEEQVQRVAHPHRFSGTVWKNLSIRRLHSFPSAYRVKKMLAQSISARSNPESASFDSPEVHFDEAWPKPPGSRPPWRSFTHDEIVMATNSFDNENLVGKGGYAQVFKGVLANGEVIAVKKLTRESEEMKERDFLTELGIIGHVCHRNTSMLIGFCIENGLHLVYKYSPHGSVASILHAAKGSVMDWSARYRVAVGVAKGLHYLHKQCPRRIIHRDIKSSNILLGPDFDPQISDFGLAKWLPEQWTHHTVDPVEGTIGYLAPEYFMHGIVDEKTDVFAYGVLLLELITGRRPVDAGGQNLVMWARPLLEANNVQELVDRRLGSAYDAHQLRKLVLAATLCVRQSGIWRPSMNQVLDLLTEEATQTDAVSEDWNKLVNKSLEMDNAAVHLETDYSSDNYENDMCRHRELALSF